MFIFEAINKNRSIWEVKNQIDKTILDLTTKKNDQNETALILACKQKKLTWVDFLLSLGADPKDVNSSGQNALQLLIDKDTPLIYISALIELGADPNHRDGDGQSAFFYALHNQREDLTHLLLSEGANPNLLDNKGNGPLLLAALAGNIRALELFFESGIKVDVTNLQGQNALHMATLSGSTEVVNLLLEAGVAINAKDIFGRSSLHYATVMENPDVTEILAKAGVDLNTVDQDGVSALALAAMQGLPEQVKVLLKFGANAQGLDKKNETTLVKALQQKPISCFQIFASEKSEVDPLQKIKGSREDLSYMNEALKVRGSDLEKNLPENFMVKGSAAEKNLPENFMVKGSAAEKNLTENFLVKSSGNSLHDKYAEVAELLLKAGSSIEFENDIRNNPGLFERVNQNERLLKTLLNHKEIRSLGQLNSTELPTIVPEINHKPKSEEPNKREDILNLEETSEVKNLPLNAKDSKGTPYLIVFASKGQEEVVEQLIKQGHDCKNRNKLGQTALMVASELGHVQTVKIILKYDININFKNCRGENALLMAILGNKIEVASLLLKAGANPDVRYKGSYFLHLIAENGRIELAKIMLQNGSNPRVKDIKGRTPAQYAKTKGFIELEGILGGPKENS